MNYKWRVTYEDLELKAGRRPFWRIREIADAPTRKAAIEEVSCRFSPPQYGNYRASKVRGTQQNSHCVACKSGDRP